MQSLNFVTALRDMVNDALLEVHTSVPASVSSVDYGGKTVTVKPLVKNKLGTNKTTSYPTLYDVPIVVSGGGQSRMTFPISAGDIGVVIFSERDPSTFLQSTGDDSSEPLQTKPLGLYPICFIPKVATSSDSSDAIDPNNVTVKNVSSNMSFSPEGEIIISNDSSSLKMAEDGTLTLTNDGGTLTLTTSGLIYSGGSINLNGLVITSEGLMTDGNGLSFATHRHGDVQNGSGQTSIPVGA